LFLERGDVLLVDELVIHRGNGILPDELFGRDFGAEIARTWTHVTVCQLEPGARERIRELLRVLEEAPRDFLVSRVETQREVSRQHGRPEALRRDMRVGDGAGTRAILRPPLVCAGRALRQLPLIAEQVLEEIVVPLRRRSCPGDFQAAGDGITRPAGAVAALPT